MGSGGWDDYGYDMDLVAEYEEELIAHGIQDRSEDAIREYLGTFGDAVQERIDAALATARELRAEGRHGLAVVTSATAIELTIRFLILRPLLSGAFLSDAWARMLTGRVVGGRTAEDRDLMPLVCAAWDFDLLGVEVPAGVALWSVISKEVWATRNAVVHGGAPATEAQAASAVEAAELLLSDVVAPIARRFRLSWPATPWHKVRLRHEVPLLGTSTLVRDETRSFSPSSPFDR